uniref:C2 domain containing 3 centriole elongation regulator n=1 Tax=Kryptolebias marmoratus TaxID=37003 RepID=A0A3Q3A8A3_KRYMA
MKNKKQKSVKAGSIILSVPSDVAPSTSLPPLVEGQLRCFLCVTISRVLWTVHKPPPPTFIRLRWWGESSNGTHFFPRDGSQLSQKTIKTTARFPIRCGPKQFTSYLTDMGFLVLEVLTKPDHLPIARAQVAGISRLSLSQPISGFYTLVSPTSDKLGEVQVSLNLEPLTEAYDSSSSGPATDANTDGMQAATLTVPSHHKSLSAGSGKESAGSSGGNTPRGKDHLYFQNDQKEKEETLENQIPTSNKSHLSQKVVIHSTENSSHVQPTADILSVILQRGNKLRNAMVVSALKCDMDSVPPLKDGPLPLPTDNIQLPDKSVFLFLFNKIKQFYHFITSQYAVFCLFFRSPITSLPLWDTQASPPDSLSGHSSVCGDSELNDPLYDQSLLENLFFFFCLKSCFEPVFSFFSSKPDHQQSAEHGDVSHLPLSVEHLSLLSLIRFVRVTIDSLVLPAGSSNIALKKTSKGKPPRPLPNKNTYFVEYVFPMTSASSCPDRSKAGDVEVTRAVSSKVMGGAVKFHQVSVFPVHFSTAAIKQWWETDLTFKVYSRTSDQKKPVAVGEAVHPLRGLLQSKELSQSVAVPVQSLEGVHRTQEIGPLKVSIELGTHSKDFSTKKHKKLAWRDTSPSVIPPSPERETVSTSQHADTGREAALDSSRLHVWTPQKPSEEHSSHPAVRTSPFKSSQRLEEDPEVLLHALLVVPDGKNFSCEPLQAPNVYLNCKLFWCDETARSAVSWGQANPTFNFVQVTPVALTTKLLERMKNNVMVIEVWQKTGRSSQDRLFGLVKLPLHQFYMSFRDPKISRLLLQAQYPVLGVDCYMPVVDVFSGSCRGNLRVVLAMGRSEQIISLQRSRDEEYHTMSPVVRPVHMLDHQSHSQTQVSRKPQVDVMREHVFVIRVEKVSGLMPLQSTVWGEADCYIQYSFTCQEGDVVSNVDQSLIETSKPFRTTTTLCVPDPVFGHTETHVLLAPDGVPVQKLLLSSLSAQGLSDGGGILFEVWCRYYYPNVRDQLVARGLLPLSKLCAMATMQSQHPNEAQMFSLPLIPRTEGPTGFQPQPSGTYIHISTCNVIGAASRAVTVVVQVHRASGLKAAARLISEEDQKFSYFVDVGVNPFVTVQLSFLPESERRCTRAAARTFCPEFDHHMEVSCDLLLHMSSGETCSLAEQLEQASAVFTVWNRESHRGAVKVPLADLIHKRTGISGWFGLYINREKSPSQPQHVLVGGLEVSISFAHPSDRERVIKAAQGLGWEMPQCDRAQQDDEEYWEESLRKLSLTFSVPKAWLPVHCLLQPGLREFQRPTYCYFRYKFFDQDAFCSRLKHPCVEEDWRGDQATVSFEGSRTVELRLTQPLMWYLREEKLEVQVWVTFNKNRTARPSNSDRLVGSAFVDLSSFAKTQKQKLTLSGVYPLFMRSAADLQGAALRVHVILTAGSVPTNMSTECDTQLDSDSQEEVSLQEVEVPDRDRSSDAPRKSNTQSSQKGKSIRATPDLTFVQNTETSVDDTFSVTVAVDRAMHLNLKGCPLAERSEEMPCCCVSYATADSAEPVSTSVVANSDCPEWDHQHECRLSKELLVDPQQSFVFKVWHKGEIERVIGFASVDLSPLLCGFSSVCGWYNITDFSGQCHGQIKVSVTPLRGVQDLRGQRKTVPEEATKNSSVRLLFYRQFLILVSLFYPLCNKLIYGIPQVFRHTVFGLILYRAKIKAKVQPTLFFSYRRKLSELDNIQKYFSNKLSTPTFPSMTEQDRHSQDGETRNSEIDTNQLLLKSNQLVGEVNHIISGELQKDRQSSKGSISEDEQKQETSFRQDDEEKEEDYEEVVLKPRPLNEVTSLTDRTSPWTSILSDPELVSVESIEAPKDSDLSEDEDERRQAVDLETRSSEEKHWEDDHHHSSAGSEGDTSDTQRNDERTLQESELQPEEPNSPNERSGDTKPPSLPLEVPNFFLPSHQLEASLRVIRLAPSFSKTSSGTVSIYHQIHTSVLCSFSSNSLSHWTEMYLFVGSNAMLI